MPSNKGLNNQHLDLGTADTLPPQNIKPDAIGLPASSRIAALGRQVFAAILAALRTVEERPPETINPTVMTPATVERANRESNDTQQLMKSVSGLVVNRGYKKALALLLSNKQKDSQVYQEIINYLYPERSDNASNEPKESLTTLILSDWLEYAKNHKNLNYLIFAATIMLEEYAFEEARDILKKAQILQYKQAIASKSYGLAVAAASWLEKNHPDLNITVEETITSQLENENNPDVILRIARIQAEFEVKNWKSHLTNAIKLKYESLKTNKQYRAAYEFIQKNRDNLTPEDVKQLLLEARINFINESKEKEDYESVIDLSMEVLHSHHKKKNEKEFNQTLRLAFEKVLARAEENNNKPKLNHYSLLASSLKLT